MSESTRDLALYEEAEEMTLYDESTNDAEPEKAEPKAKKEGDAPKKDAKPVDLNKPMPLKAQEQGFSGKKVQHVDGKNQSADWQKEYGNSFTQGEPKKDAAKAKKDAAPKKEAKPVDLNKPMPLKAQEQGFSGKKVQHVDGKNHSADWQKEYGNSQSFTQSSHLRGDPKKKEAAAPAKKEGGSKKEDLMKKMPLKAQEQGYTGDKVQHKDGETKTDDWRDEYGHPKAAPPAPKKSGSMQSATFSAAVVLTITSLALLQ